MPKIKNRQPRLLGLCTGTHLLPGQDTEISDEEFAVVQKDEVFRSWCKRSWVSVVGATLQQGAPLTAIPEGHKSSREDALAGKTCAEVIEMAGAESDMDTLLAWHALETRKTARKAMEDRLAVLVDEANKVKAPEDIADPAEPPADPV